MNEFMKKQCPDWANETNLEFDLMIGNDSDSALSCNLLEDITNGNWKVNYFYDFENFYRHDKTNLPVVGVDMAFSKNVRCFDNHVTKQYPYSPYNKVMINPNMFYDISADKNYYKKYPFSTLILVMAYYDIPLPKSDIGKDIILAVDSSFKGHYTSKKHFKDIHTEWLERMGFIGLIDRLNMNPIDYYYNIQKQFGLNEPINITDKGLLSSRIDFEGLQPYLNWKIGLPEKKFKLIKECQREGHYLGKKQIPDREKLISLAYTAKDYVSYTHIDLD